MFDLINENAVLLTILAGFSQSFVLGLTLYVFYKNLVVMRDQNKSQNKRFDLQSKIEKHKLTLTFADWVKSELSDYTPDLHTDTQDSALTKEEIKNHFKSIADIMLSLVKSEIIYKSLVLDEIKKMIIVLNTLEDTDYYILELQRLLDNSKPEH